MVHRLFQHLQWIELAFKQVVDERVNVFIRNIEDHASALAGGDGGGHVHAQAKVGGQCAVVADINTACRIVCVKKAWPVVLACTEAANHVSRSFVYQVKGHSALATFGIEYVVTVGGGACR
ncbi:hypothetical protein AN901_201182 [Pseudomonas syringae pv. theae]|nr:hypothetical protein AN901_201182 [Pseudomonas syringae pv. theae]